MTRLSTQTLADGTIRLQGRAASLLIARLQVGAVFVAIVGDDDGAFGDAPFAELDAEIARFGRPLELFIDLSGAVGASSAVAEAWTRWFDRRRKDLLRVHVLVQSRWLGITVEIARHYAGANALITMHQDPAQLWAAVARAVPEDRAQPIGPGWMTAPAVAIERRSLPDHHLRLSAPRCTFTYGAPKHGVVTLDIDGHDAGQLGAAALDELEAQVLRQQCRVEVFCDATRASATTQVSELWTAWLASHRATVGTLHMLVGSKVLGLVVAIASARAGTSSMMRVYSDRERFDAALRR